MLQLSRAPDSAQRAGRSPYPCEENLLVAGGRGLSMHGQGHSVASPQDGELQELRAPVREGAQQASPWPGSQQAREAKSLAPQKVSQARQE